MTDDHQTHRRKPQSPPGPREACARSRTTASSEPKPRLKRSGAFLLPAMQWRPNVTNDPVVAIAGVTGAVGAEFIATMDKRGFPRRQAQGAGKRALGRQDHRLPRQEIVIEELDRALLRGRRHRAVLGRRRHFQEVRADRGEGRRRRGRQFLGLPHGPERAAGDPRDQRHRIRDHKGIIANPNCAAITALVPLWPIHQQQPHQARDHFDLSGGERRRCRGDGRAGGIDPRQPQRAGLSAQGDAAPLRLQPVQPQHRDRSRDRLQRRRDQGHQGDAQNLRGRQHRRSA